VQAILFEDFIEILRWNIMVSSRKVFSIEEKCLFQQYIGEKSPMGYETSSPESCILLRMTIKELRLKVWSKLSQK